MNKLVGLICVAILLAVFAQRFVERPAITKEELGRNLFFDPILSRNHTVSCASCHKPDFAFADTSSFSAGVNGRMGNRNTPWSKTSLWLGFLVAKFSHEDTKPLRKIQYQQQPGTRNAQLLTPYQLIFLLANMTSASIANKPILPISSAVSSSLINTKIKVYNAQRTEANSAIDFQFWKWLFA